MLKKINSALISVYHKDNLDEIIQLLDENDVKIYSTGGTYDYIKNLGNDAISVESITNYPSILGGRVKTLHPKIFGGILGRRNNQEDKFHFQEYDIPEIDLVIVDLYPFEETVASGKNENEIIEKIDIGGISLIRAAAKNFNDVLVVPSSDYYEDLITLLKEKNGQTELSDRRTFAQYAFNVSSHYDTAIFQAFKEVEVKVREVGSFPPEEIGVSLMRKAFAPEIGPLSDTHTPRAEQEALAHLFAGAIGCYKNPHSHRSVTISPEEAVEMIILASHLLGIVYQRDFEKKGNVL